MATKWLKVAKSGTSPLQTFWKNSEFFKDTLRTKITSRNLLKEIVCENQNFRLDLTVLSVIISKRQYFKNTNFNPKIGTSRLLQQPQNKHDKNNEIITKKENAL